MVHMYDLHVSKCVACNEHSTLLVMIILDLVVSPNKVYKDENQVYYSKRLSF